MQEIKHNEDEMIEYLRDRVYKQKRLREIFSKEHGKFRDGLCFYETCTEQDWWLDVEKDSVFKANTFALLQYAIGENLKIDVLRKALSFLLQRHESLRAVFKKHNGKFWMQIKDASDPVFNLDYREIGVLNKPDDAEISSFIDFRDHKFNLSDGPLFLARIVKKEHEYLMSLKLHHVIYDGWSIDVMIRDLSTAYLAISKNELPPLKPLKYQYRDYMCYRNMYRKDFFERDKNYWASRFNSLPPELIIPGEKRREPGSTISARISALEKYSLPGNVIRILTTFAARRSTTLFILLQAALKFYIFSSTGQNDIVIGTQVLGREDLEQIEDQIGFYTKMNLIRTILNNKDSFEDCLAKVIRSNEDMYTYTAFPLMDHLEKMLPPNEHITGKFWKITMQYYDSRGFANYEPGPSSSQESIPVTAILNLNKQIIENIDLKLEFYNEQDRLNVHIIYDQALYEREAILVFLGSYYQFLKDIFNFPPEA